MKQTHLWLPQILSTLENVQTSSNKETTVTKPTFSSSSGTNAASTRRLVLHFDINETILVGDEAGGDTRHDCLNKIIAKSSFVQMFPPSQTINGVKGTTEEAPLSVTSKIEPTHWWDGTPINPVAEETSPPPLYTGWNWPPNSCPYYRTSYKSKAKTFTTNDGQIYQSLYNEMEARLVTSWETTRKQDKKNDLPPVLEHILPAFFHTIYTLKKLEKNFTLVLRTFGSDLPDIVDAINVFASGKHPEYSDYVDENLMIRCKDQGLFRGRYRYDETTNDYVYELLKWSNDVVVASGDENILKILEERTCCGIQDDYEFWSKNDCHPTTGKPVWVVESNRKDDSDSMLPYHVMFDDNIHNDETDSIVAVRYGSKMEAVDEGIIGTGVHDVKSKDEDVSSSSSSSLKTTRKEKLKFRPLSGRETIQMQGKHIFRVPTLEPIMNKDWFLDQIATAEANI